MTILVIALAVTLAAMAVLYLLLAFSQDNPSKTHLCLQVATLFGIGALVAAAYIGRFHGWWQAPLVVGILVGIGLTKNAMSNNQENMKYFCAIVTAWAALTLMVTY